MVWTDDRLDDRFAQIDRRFDRVDAELLELRREMRAGFAELHIKIDRLTTAMIVSQAGLIASIVALGLLR